MSDIKLLDVVKYYADAEHQKRAIAYLQGAIPADVLAKFAELWRSQPAPPKYVGRAIPLPNGKTVYTDQPIVENGNFTWGEATHGGDRIPMNQRHIDNIVALAVQLEKFRKQIGKPFRVTSWYRPEPWNSAVGGARLSQHLTGKAVDIVVEGFLGRQLGALALPWWPGGLGIYPGNRQHILHLDIGPKRHWGF